MSVGRFWSLPPGSRWFSIESLAVGPFRECILLIIYKVDGLAESSVGNYIRSPWASRKARVTCQGSLNSWNCMKMRERRWESVTLANSSLWQAVTSGLEGSGSQKTRVSGSPLTWGVVGKFGLIFPLCKVSRTTHALLMLWNYHRIKMKEIVWKKLRYP